MFKQLASYNCGQSYVFKQLSSHICRPSSHTLKQLIVTFKASLHLHVIDHPPPLPTLYGGITKIYLKNVEEEKNEITEMLKIETIHIVRA